MQEVVKIVNTDLSIKSIDGQRVVTFSDIDKVHERVEGTAKRNFTANKKYLIENEDYFILKPSDIQKNEIRTSEMCEKHTIGIDKKDVNNRGTTFLTESGYLLLVKSFTDDLAWKVQRDLVNTYFKFNEVVQNFNSNYPIDTNALNAFLAEMKKNLPCVYAQINHIENTLDEVVDNMTLSTRQQEKIHEAARKRINYLLGGAHSIEYKQNARSYMINLWNGLKATFHCGSSYKDLNPKDFEKAIDYINHWIYEE